MENINYKYTTLGLLFLLIVLFAWNWQSMLQRNNFGGMSGMNMKGMHMMPDGTMMNNDGSDMDMGSMTMDQMVDDMKGLSGKELEKAFLTGMIPHHQGAVDMARLLLEDKTVDPKVAKFANDIIVAQESEIQMMEEWLKD